MHNAPKHHHKHPTKCDGYGLIPVRNNPNVTEMLRASLLHNGLLTATKKVGITELLKFGSKHCEECRRWLRL